MVKMSEGKKVHYVEEYMFVRPGLFAFLTFLLALTMWSCKENVVSVGMPVSVKLSGIVFDASSSAPLNNATVVLTYGGVRDSLVTKSDGTFQFVIDVQDSTRGQYITLTISEAGYISRSISATVKSDQNFQIGLNVDLSIYALVKGVVRDSASGYPLGGASVMLTLPGKTASKFLSHIRGHISTISSFVLDSTTTLMDGSFNISINLFDIDSISATLLVYKTGFKTYQSVRTFKKGTNNLGNILLQIDNSASMAHVTGRVTDSRNGAPLTNATVIISSSLKKDSTKTLNDGSYSFDLNLQGLSSTSGTLFFKLNSYRDTTVNFSVNAGQVFVKDVGLTAQATVVGSDSTGRGIPRSFALISASPTELSVHGVGGNESSVLVWEVRDSLGFPVDINHRDTVFFEITGIPVTAGGAYVTPSLALTDGAGRVSTTINSGTVSGTIQVIAWLRREPGGDIIRSTPVLLTVDGGLPDQAHFSIGVQQHNFAGYGFIGRTNNITVLAGDKYGNPVHPNTAIYFTTSGGVITASGFTNTNGQATATLISGNPLPKALNLDPNSFGDGTGYAWVKALTNGENSTIVSDSALVLFSGATDHILLNGTPDTLSVSVPNHGLVNIKVHISDINGNPLAPGTTITKTVDFSPPQGTNWNVKADGLPSSLADFLTRGQGTTDFVLTISADEIEGSPQAMTFNVSIVVSGPNGSRQAYINGRVTP